MKRYGVPMMISVSQLAYILTWLKLYGDLASLITLFTAFLKDF